MKYSQYISEIPLYSRIAVVIIMLFAMTSGPVMAQGFSVSYDRVEYFVSGGTSFSGSIGVLNISDEPMDLRVYIGDWVRVPDKSDGYTFETEPGLEPRSFIEWMTFTPEVMTINPDEKRDVRYQVNIPPDESFNGSYWGVIYIENVAPELPEQDESDDTVMRVGITTVFRYAIQIYATIEGTEIRDVMFTEISMEQVEGGFDVITLVENLGNIYLKPRVWLELINPQGETVYEFEHPQFTLLPESTRNYIFQLRDLPVEPGPYLVRVLADYGVPTLIACQGRIEIILESDASTEPVEVEDST